MPNVNPAVGDLEFVTFRGVEPADPVMRLKEITREGIDGHAFMEIGKRGVPVRIIAEGDVDDVAALRTDLQALVSAFVTVTFSDGGTVEQVLVLDAQVADEKFTGSPVGGLTGGAWWVTVAFTLLGTKV